MSENVEETAEKLTASLKNLGEAVGTFFISSIRSLKSGVCIFGVIFLAVSPTAAQQADELQKQLEQLKQQYEKTTRDLQDRIAALEQQIKKESEDKKNANRKGEV